MKRFSFRLFVFSTQHKIEQVAQNKKINVNRNELKRGKLKTTEELVEEFQLPKN